MENPEKCRDEEQIETLAGLYSHFAKKRLFGGLQIDNENTSKVIEVLEEACQINSYE